MFGKKAAKKANEQAAGLSALATKREEEAAKPTPLQSAEDTANLKFLDFENRTGEFAGKPTNVLDAPGLANDVDLYNAAIAADTGEQGGQGLLSMGETGSAAQPGLAMLIKQNRADRRKVVAGAALADALRARSARAHGYVLPSSSLTQSRTMGLAGLTGSRADSSSARAAQLAMQSGFFNSNLFNQLMGGAQTAARVWGG